MPYHVQCQKNLSQGAILSSSYSKGFHHNKKTFRLTKFQELVGSLQTSVLNASLLQDGNDPGSQYVGGPFPFAHQDHLLTIMRNNLFQVPPVVGGAHDTTWEYILKGFKVDYALTNQTNVPLEFTIYDCIAKKDECDAVRANPASAWQQGSFEQTNQVTVDNTLQWGAVPDNVPMFYTFWRVVNKSCFTINAGGVHMHNFNSVVNHVINTDYLNQYKAFKGITYVPLIVVRGFPYHLTVTGPPSVESSTTGLVCFAIATSVIYKYYAIANGKTHKAVFTDNIQHALPTDTKHFIVQNDLGVNTSDQQACANP